MHVWELPFFTPLIITTFDLGVAIVSGNTLEKMM